MRIFIFILSILVSTSGFSGGDGEDSKTTSGCYKITKIDSAECSTLTPPAPQEKKEDCPEPKKEPKKKSEPKPKKKPTPKKVCPKCTPKVVTKTKIETKYIAKSVFVDRSPKNTLEILVGIGPHGLVSDYYETAERDNEYAFRKEDDKSIGGVFGIQYKYRFNSSYSVGAMLLSNETIMASGGWSW